MMPLLFGVTCWAFGLSYWYEVFNRYNIILSLFLFGKGTGADKGKQTTIVFNTTAGSGGRLHGTPDGAFYFP